MDDVVKVLKRAAVRLFFDRLIASFAVTFTIAAVVLIGVRLAERLAGITIDWPVAWIIAASASLLISIVWSLAHAANRAKVARLVDERASLRESLSTAVSLGERSDAWSAAAIEQARTKAKSVDLRRAVPMTLPKRWPAPALAGLTLLVVWFVAPQMDLLGKDRELKDQQKQQQEVDAALAESQTIDNDLKKMLAKLGADETVSPEEGSLDKNKPTTPDEIRRATIRKLTAAQDRLESLKSSAGSRSLDEIKDRMRQLRQPGMGPVNEMVSAMQRGNFAKASQKLAEMMNQMSEGKLTPEQKEALKKQLANLAEQMKKLAEKRDELEKRLKQAGLDPNKMQTPGAMQQAIQNAQGLSDQQKQELLRQMQAAQDAAAQMGQMAQAMRQAAGEMAEGKDGMKGMQGMSTQLSDLEMIQQQLAQIGAAQNFAWGKIDHLSQCLGGGKMPERSPFQMWNEHMGKKRAAGNGSSMTASDLATATSKVKANSKTLQGPIIGSTMVQGQQVRGEARAQFTKLVEAGEQAAADAIESKVAPREFQDTLKHYFGRLKAKAEAQTAPSPQTPDPASPAPGTP